MENGIKQMEGLSREKVYNFLVDFIKKNGYSPTVREICVGIKIVMIYRNILKKVTA